MLAAAIKAQSTENKNDHIHQNYQDFVLLFSCCLIHEIGHVFLTYLIRDDEILDSPDSMTPVWKDVKDEPGSAEAGFYLEQLIYGGTLSFLHNRDTSIRVENVGSDIAALA